MLSSSILSNEIWSVNPEAAFTATAASLRRMALTDVVRGPSIMQALERVEADLRDLGDRRTRTEALDRLRGWEGGRL